MSPEEELAQSLVLALRPGFAERQASALAFAELLLDGVGAALPLTRHEPAEPALSELEALAQETDLYAWGGAPGWDVVLAHGLLPRQPIEPGPSPLDGLGERPDRIQQRGELKRRARAEAEKLVRLGREAVRFRAGGTFAGAQVLDEMPTLPAPAAMVAAHASLLRLVGLGAASTLLSLQEDEQLAPPPPPAEERIVREMEERGEGFLAAQEEWLALLLSRNPAAAHAPAFRTFYAGLSQTLRVALALREFRDAAREGKLAPDAEAVLGALGTWQPVRWSSLRAGVPAAWISALCPAAPEDETPLERLARECSQALDLFGRLFFAQELALSAFAALGTLLTARCAAIAALWEELGGGASSL